MVEDPGLPDQEECPRCHRMVHPIQVYSTIFGDGRDGCTQCIPARRYNSKLKEWYDHPGEEWPEPKL